MLIRDNERIMGKLLENHRKTQTKTVENSDKYSPKSEERANGDTIWRVVDLYLLYPAPTFFQPILLRVTLFFLFFGTKNNRILFIIKNGIMGKSLGICVFHQFPWNRKQNQQNAYQLSCNCITLSFFIALFSGFSALTLT